MAKSILQGITWGHSRGITPLLAAAQRFNELFPDIEIQWKKRTLQEFADFPIEKLTEKYDLLIIDHPWVGCAAATNCVLPLDKYLSPEFLKDQSENSTGLSHDSYYYNGHQWALAIDAATPTASYRADLLQQNKISLPQTWEDVLVLAKEGKVAVPAIPIDLLMNFYTFCLAHGGEPFQNNEEIIDAETGVKALETMRQLYSLVDKEMFHSNPITVAELMSKTDDYWYCPFAYCYSNYSRSGYAKNRLAYADVVNFNGQQLRTTIGGTGLSVSAFSEYKDIALQFAELVTSGLFQSTFYIEHGGQPGHRAAWESEDANRLTNNFFSTLLPTMQRGYVRPRYNGYLHFQDTAGEPLYQFLLKGGNPISVLQDMNRLYQESLVHELKLQP
jgi:multiple sugar transport system substrate-binding protein